MDLIIKHFVSHASPQTLIDYRDVVRRSTDYVSRQFESSVLCDVTDADQAIIRTGSVAEGATLSRVFCEDESVANELECDFMYQLMILDEQIVTNDQHVFEVVPVEDCPTFAHVQCNVTADQMRLVRERMATHGSGMEENVNEVYVAKEDHIYLSSVAMRDNVARQMTALVGFFSNLSCTPGTTEMFDITKGNASITLSIRYPLEAVDANAATTPTTPMTPYASSTEEPSPDAAKVHDDGITVSPNKLTEVKRSTEFQTSDEHRYVDDAELVRRRIDVYVRQAKEISATYDVLVSEFQQTRGASRSLKEQTSKANELMKHCVEMNDFYFSARKQTLGFLLEKLCGVDLMALMGGDSDTKWKQLLKQLEYSEEDGAERRLETALDLVQKSHTKDGQVTVAFRAGMDQLVDDVRVMLDQLQRPGPTEVNKLRKIFGTTVRHLSFDIVPCIRLQNWPSVAREWIERKRDWPETEIIRDIVNSGTHLVVKTHCHDDIDWRLSFSIAEVRLAGLWTPWQHYVYFVFKSLFYKFIKPLDKNNLACGELTSESANRLVQSSDQSSQPKKFVTSFLAKTVMLHVSEGLMQSEWSEANAPACLTTLLFALQSAFETRNLPHYFVSSFNLLRGIPDDLANSATRALEKIFDDEQWAIGQLANHFGSMKIMLDAVDDQQSVMTKAETSLNETMQRLVNPMTHYPSNPVIDWQSK